LAGKIAEDKQRTNLIKTLAQSIEDREDELAAAVKADVGMIRASLTKFERQEKDARQAENLVREHVTKCRALVGDGPKGKFSGACPIDGCECPRVDEINKDVTRRKAAAEAVTTAEIDLRQAVALVSESGRGANSARKALADVDALAKRVPALNAELNRMRMEYQRAVGDGLLDASAADRLGVMKQQLTSMQREQMKHEQSEKMAAKLLGETDDLASKVDVLKWASRASGRDGVVGLAMRESLVRIEAEANGVLEGMGAAHRLSFEEDGQGKVVVMVVDQSGRRPLAADSGGGKAVLALAVRVALSKMLGAKVLFLDEICGALDPSALDELGSMLRALPGLGFEQVFVISHRDEIASGMERKIVVTRDRMSGSSTFSLEG
jgi:DNA repair exonuclease SbcCD ATPase subunit